MNQGSLRDRSNSFTLYPEAQANLEKGLELSGRSSECAAYLGYYYGKKGMRTEALDMLEQDFHDHSSELGYLLYDPTLEDIRTAPQFVALMKKVGLVKQSPGNIGHIEVSIWSRIEHF